jgi:hypothetical protein
MEGLKQKAAHKGGCGDFQLDIGNANRLVPPQAVQIPRLSDSFAQRFGLRQMAASSLDSKP